MSTELHSLAYYSRNAIEGTPEQVQAEIATILASARRKNRERGITGALIFSDGLFAQVLEGERDSIEAVFEIIQCDMRHREVTMLHLSPVDERSFGEWSMAFGGLDGDLSDPTGSLDGIVTPDRILATPAGRVLVESLRGVVHRDDLARSQRVG